MLVDHRYQNIKSNTTIPAEATEPDTMHRFGSRTGKSSTFNSWGLIVRWTVLLLCCCISVHCALRPTPRDLTVYINRDIYGVAELEKLALTRYDDLTGANYVSDLALRDALDTTIIPVYGRFADLVGNITPQTPAVKRLHAIYRNAAALRLQGFRLVLLAIETQDPDLVRQANRMLDQGQGFVQQWQKDLAVMVDEYELELQ